MIFTLSTRLSATVTRGYDKPRFAYPLLMFDNLLSQGYLQLKYGLVKYQI